MGCDWCWSFWQVSYVSMAEGIRSMYPIAGTEKPSPMISNGDLYRTISSNLKRLDNESRKDRPNLNSSPILKRCSCSCSQIQQIETDIPIIVYWI